MRDNVKRTYLAFQLVYLLTIIAGYFIIYQSEKKGLILITVGLIIFILTIIGISSALIEEEIFKLSVEKTTEIFSLVVILPLGFLVFRNSIFYYYVIITMLVVSYLLLKIKSDIKYETVRLENDTCFHIIYYMSFISTGLISMMCLFIKGNYYLFLIGLISYQAYLMFFKHYKKKIDFIINSTGMILFYIMILLSLTVSYQNESIYVKTNLFSLTLGTLIICIIIVFNRITRVKQKNSDNII